MQRKAISAATSVKARIQPNSVHLIPGHLFCILFLKFTFRDTSSVSFLYFIAPRIQVDEKDGINNISQPLLQKSPVLHCIHEQTVLAAFQLQLFADVVAVVFYRFVAYE